MVRKAARRGADALVLDLEDGVHPSRKAEARAGLGDARALLGDARVIVRVNAGPEGRADLEAARAAGFEEALLPKAESVEAEGFRVHLMIETALGAARVFELAAARGVEGIAFGAADYRLGLGVRDPGEEPLAYVRQRLLLAARAAGIRVWDSPWFAFRDLDGLRRSARRAAGLGFDGMLAIHPAQVPVIHEAFALTDTERERARRTLDAWRAADLRGEAVAERDGELVEALHARAARKLLDSYG